MKRTPKPTPPTPEPPEMELAKCFKAVRKDIPKLSQKELAKRTGIPLGGIRKFEQTGSISLPDFLRIAGALHILHIFQSIARGEEPMTFQSLQKEKTIARLRDRLDILENRATAKEVNNSNAMIKITQPVRKFRHQSSDRWITLPEPDEMESEEDAEDEDPGNKPVAIPPGPYPAEKIIRSGEIIRKAVRASKILLFGSCARGTATKDSDIDLLVVLPDHHRIKRPTLKARMALARQDLRIPTDIIVVMESETNPPANSFIEAAINEGISL